MKLSQLCFKHIKSYYRICVDSSWRTAKINDVNWCLGKSKLPSQTRTLFVTNLHTDIKSEYDQNKDAEWALKHLTAQIECIQLSVDGVRVSLQEINTKLDRLNDLKARDMVLQSQNCEVPFKEDINNHACELVVQGLPERNNEDLRALMIKLGTVIGVQVLPEDIIAISRAQKIEPGSENLFETDSQRPSKSIFVRLTSPKLRNYIMSSRKKYGKVLSSQIDSTFDNTKVYVYPFVSKHLHELRILIKAKIGHEYKRIWVSNNSVFICKTYNSPVIKINNVDQLEHLLKYNI